MQSDRIDPAVIGLRARGRVADCRDAPENPVTDHDHTSHSYPVEISALVRVLGDRVRQQVCQLRSISLGGTFIEVGRLPMGTQVNITFGLPTIGERISLDAVVHWSTDYGVGVQFEGMRARQVWALWRYLESVTGAEPEAWLGDTKEIIMN
jgi:hypothetical protein